MPRTQANSQAASDTIIEVDFTGTEERRGGGRQAHVPPGDYLLEVVEAAKVAVKSDPTGQKQQVRWIFRIAEGEAGIGGLIYHYTTLDSTQKGGLWQLYNIISDLAGGAEIPKQKAKIDLASKVGKRLGALLVDDDPWERPNDDGTTTTIEKSVISTTYAAEKFVGKQAPKAVTPAQAAAQPAPAAQQNGAAPVDVAAAIVTPTDEDADIKPLPVVEL
jgi:hypothetical protein